MAEISVTQSPYIAHIVIKFKEDGWQDLQKIYTAKEEQNGTNKPYKGFIQDFPDIPIRRLFPTMDTENSPENNSNKIINAISDYLGDRQYLNKLFTYFVADCPAGVKPQKLLSAILADSSVEIAYIDLPSSNPNSNSIINNSVTNVDKYPAYFLSAKKGGIGVLDAWQILADHSIEGIGKGQGQILIDIERGWSFTHPDLFLIATTSLTNISPPPPLYGDMLSMAMPHGTSVLGVACGKETEGHCAGIAPEVAEIKTVSTISNIYKEESGCMGLLYNRPGAIVAAIDYLVAKHAVPNGGINLKKGFSLGGVLLLEAQLDVNYNNSIIHLPIELLPAEYDAIRLATELGISVIEVSGNGGYCLDNQLSTKILFENFGKTPPYTLHKRHDHAVCDSGAILVGAVASECSNLSNFSHKVLNFSNYGNCVDCYAWGENVLSPAIDLLNVEGLVSNGYTTGFGGTSSAAAIIAGVVLVIQGIVANTPNAKPLLPSQIRQWLSDRDINIPCEDDKGNQVGVMPNLAKIIEKILLHIKI